MQIMLGLCQTDGVSQKKETPDNLEFLHNCLFPLVPIPHLNQQFVPPCRFKSRRKIAFLHERYINYGQFGI